jgi:ABC-type transport system substrate-binding protein
VLTRNPSYWEPGKPYLDTIDYQLSFSPSTALLKLQSGEIDALGDGVPPADVPRVMADPQWKALVYTQPLIAISYMFMNVEMKPFDDVKVRQALSWAIDRDKLVKLQAGQAMSLWQFYPKGMPGHEEGKVFYGYDPAKAKQLLADAGYPDGFKTMLYTDNVDPNPKLWQSVQADLAAVGVKASLKTMSNNTYYNQQGTPETLTAGSFGWWMDFPDPSDWIAPLFSKASAVPGGMNSSFWWSPELETMFTEAQKMTDPAARIAKFTEMQEYIATQAPYVPCYQPIQTTMCSETTGGFYLHPVYQIDPTQYWKK